MQENSTKVIYFPSHHQLSESEINSYLTQKGMQTRKQGTQISIKVCPFCHPVQNQTDMYALKFTPDTGAYFCHRCRANGSWNDLRARFGDGPMIGKAWQSRSQQVVQRPMPEPLLADSYPQNLKFVPNAIDTLAQRKISQETLDLYQVGTIPRNFYNEEAQRWDAEDCWTYPLWINSSGRPEIVRYKLRSISNKAHMRLEPTGGIWGLFGLNAVPSQSDTVILAEGEFDALAIYEQTKIPALSVPNGANSCPDEVVEILKQFSKIYLWFDNDAAGYQGVERYAAKIGRERCLVIPNIDAKDANDALLKGQNLLDNIAKAKPLPHENILHLSDLRDALYSEFANPETAKGVRATSLPQFSDALGGLRMGEVTLLSGVTGGGKTTVLSQLSMDYAKQGVPTLWGSFEIKNVKLAKTMIRQFSKRNFESNLHDFDAHADAFMQLPIYFTSFFGFTPLDELLNVIRYAVKAIGVTHVCLDNLQFMCNGGTTSNWQDEFQVQGKVLTALRALATQQNIHITLVIHPRKQDADGKEIGVNDIFGRGQATQEADNIVILQSLDDNSVRYIDIKKNRDQGILRKIHYKFDDVSRLITELSTEEKSGIVSSRSSFKGAKGIPNHTDKENEDLTGRKLVSAGSDYKNNSKA